MEYDPWEMVDWTVVDVPCRTTTIPGSSDHLPAYHGLPAIATAIPPLFHSVTPAVDMVHPPY